MAAVILASCSSLKLVSGQLYETKVGFSGMGSQNVILAADFASLMRVFNDHGLEKADYDSLSWMRIDKTKAHQLMSDRNAMYLVRDDGNAGLYLTRRSNDGFEYTVIMTPAALATTEAANAAQAQAVTTDGTNTGAN